VVSIIGRLDYGNNFTACQILPFDMDKKMFKPNPGFGFNEKRRINNMSKDICDFVINQK